MLDSDLLSPARILANVKINSKKRVLELISLALAKRNKQLDAAEIFEGLCAREQLGSTALGHGVAIPHARISRAKDAEALFLRLTNPLPFGAEDGQPVDLMFALGFPEDCTTDHRALIADIADRFSDTVLQEKIREAADANEIWHLLTASHT